jgi:hypothetical protein
VYVGGGGGGVAMVGGGLMVRPHADLLYKFDGGTAGVSVSQVRFRMALSRAIRSVW